MPAEDYFNSLSPQEQARVRASWGGADLMGQWFQNAVNAGVPQAIQASGQSFQTPQGIAYGGVAGAVAPGATPTPAQLRQQASQGRWSEDFARFSDAQLAAWLNSGLYDPASGKFRSENDPNGPAIYDKPAECPAGTTFHGTRCVPWDQMPAWAGGPGGGGSQLTQALMPWQAPQRPQIPLEQQIIEANRMAAGAGFRAGEPVPGSGTAGLGLPQVLQPFQSATGGLVQTMAAKPLNQTMTAQTMGTGWTGGQDGLTRMMARQQRGGQQGWWV